MKNCDFFVILFLSTIKMIFIESSNGKFFIFIFILESQFFYPLGGPTLTASALLQGIRGEVPQLHALRLASAAISTRE
jgi:hypothetical protein